MNRLLMNWLFKYSLKGITILFVGYLVILGLVRNTTYRTIYCVWVLGRNAFHEFLISKRAKTRRISLALRCLPSFDCRSELMLLNKDLLRLPALTDLEWFP